MQESAYVFEEIAELLSMSGAEKGGARNVTDEDLGIIRDALMVCRNGRIEWVGEKSKFKADQIRALGNHKTVSLGNATVLPGFVECHTHLVFAGNRSEEFEWRMQGQTYQEIAAKGGGILSTVRATREASAHELQRLAQARADRFARQGVTTLEVKSGYGLNLESERKILEVASRLSGPRIVKTYLGPHSRSPDHPDLSSYMNEILERDLPEIAKAKLADRVDIYIEKGFFDLESAHKFFTKARELGLPIAAHVEQLSDFGGTELAMQFEPLSVDHVVYVTEETIAKLSRSQTTAVLLPASDFYLKMKYPPAREMLDRGVRVALSTDFNPGTSPTQDLSLVGVLARVEMKMKLAEVLTAFTLGGAWALGRAHEVGSLTVGKFCDFSAFEGRWQDLFYSVGEHPVHSVYKGGEKIV